MIMWVTAAVKAPEGEYYMVLEVIVNALATLNLTLYLPLLLVLFLITEQANVETDKIADLVTDLITRPDVGLEAWKLATIVDRKPCEVTILGQRLSPGGVVSIALGIFLTYAAGELGLDFLRR